MSASNATRIDLSLVDAGLVADLSALCAALPTAGPLPETWFFTCGWRDAATEQAGYDAWKADHTKPKYTNPANSAHVGGNFPDGKSRAIDVTLVRGTDDIWDPNDPSWVALVRAVLAHPRLHGLASIGDYDHVEKRTWHDDVLPLAS